MASSATQPVLVNGVKADHAPPIARIRNLGLKRDGRWLFRGLDLEVRPGKFLAVVGPSGVGKSSFISCLAGLLEPTEGIVHYCCENGCDHPPHEYREHIGVVFQNLQLVANSTLLTNVLCGRLSHRSAWRTLLGFPRSDRNEAQYLLHDLGLGRHVHKWAAEVSGGEQQRTAIARALFQNPNILLADEPVASLDRYYSGRVLGLFRQQAAEFGRPVFCVLHNPEFVEKFADHVLSFDPNNAESWQVRDVHHPAA